LRRRSVTPFADKLGAPLTKQRIGVLQVNLGKRCNLACTHCHVEAGPKRTEELSPEVCEQLLALLDRFEQIDTMDLTGGAPEMNYGFRTLVEAARSRRKQVIVRSNLTVFFEPGYADLPSYFARQKVRVVASLPCHLEDNVDQQRGAGVYRDSVRAIQLLNRQGYGRDPELVLDLVYNPPLPHSEDFRLPPPQASLEGDYKAYLERLGVVFNNLLTIANLPIGRTKQALERRQLHQPYLRFLEANHNPATVKNLMCRNELSVDYLGTVYDCDFNQMEGIPARDRGGKALTVARLLELDDLDAIQTVQTRPYCYGCTAGSGSSCGGALV